MVSKTKNLRTVIGIMIALFLVYGCLGSGSENSQVKTVEAPAVEVAAAPTTTAAAPVVQNQDVEWIRTCGNWYQVIGQDMTSISQAASSGDLDSLYKYAKQAKGNIENAKKADSKYSVSSDYSYAHKEYLASLEDLGNAMDLIISCGDEGWTDVQKITYAVELMEKGNEHITYFGNIIKTGWL